MDKSVDYYLSKGFDKATAEYFAKGRRRITAVKPGPDFTLILTFDNGEVRQLDMKPVLLPGTVFAPFAKKENFDRVYLDDTHSVAWDIDPAIDSNVVWSNKVDICPDSCYIDSIPYAQTEIQSCRVYAQRDNC